MCGSFLKGEGMYNYTIMPLDDTHVEEICEDIKAQYENGTASCALFMMKLVPEGNPVIGKAEQLCRKYDLFRDRLAEMGLECGVLVQATIGHGYPLDEASPFTQYVGMANGRTEYVCCPYDEGFKRHFFNEFATIAKHRPKIIMVDDDFRLMARPGRGCACGLHMARINELTGEELTRSELCRRIFDENDTALREVFFKTQGESLINAARAMRDGIDSVNPSIPGCFCACGNAAEFAGEIAEILAGRGNPVIVRVNNSRYTSAGARNFTPVMYMAACQANMLRHKADHLLAETDTCPQNRYSTSASNLHAHFTASIIEGCGGAKHWITRLSSFEPESGKAYREILGDHTGFYNTLNRLASTLKHLGCRIPLPDTPSLALGWSGSPENGWHSHVLERLGFPLYFSNEPGGAVFMDGFDDEIYSDEELEKILSGTAFLSAHTAKRLFERGFGEYTGVEAVPWNGENVSGERLYVNGNDCSAQVGIHRLIPLDSAVEVCSEAYHIIGGKQRETLFPAVTRFKNAAGGTVVVFCGTPRTEYNYCEAFSFLNESRKKQMAELLSESGNLPIYYPGDAEVLLRAAYTANEGELFCAVFNIGLDVLPDIRLITDRSVKSVRVLDCDGELKPVEFFTDGIALTVKQRAEILMPVIMLINV